MREESFVPAQLTAGTQNLSLEGEANNNENYLLEDNFLNDDSKDQGMKLSKEKIGSAIPLKAFGTLPTSIVTALLHGHYRTEVIKIKSDAIS